jgi:F-type H+-transporting ATPase subunit b
MKQFNNSVRIQIIFFGGLLVLLLTGTAFAAEGGRDWRSIYDHVMEWINFSILFFIIFKYGRRPLMNFLRGQKDEIAKEFERVEAQKVQALAKVREVTDALEESKVRLPELKARLIEKGERRKEELIEEAHAQRLRIMEGARIKIEHQIVRAREKLCLQLLDMAVDEALERLPGLITAEDKQRQVEKYMAIAESN